MPNPLVNSGMVRLVDELVDLFHASRNVNMLQGVRGNPALSAGFNQGRGIYGFRSRERAMRHLDKLVDNSQGQQGDKFNSLRPSPGVSRFQVPKSSIRFDVTSLDANPKYHDAFYSLMDKNRSDIDDVLKTRTIRTMNSDPSKRERILGMKRDGRGSGTIPILRDRLKINFEKIRPPRKTRTSSTDLEKEFDYAEGEYDGDFGESIYGRLSDVLRQVDKPGYDSLLDLMLPNPGLAFRTTASPRMTEVHRSSNALDLLLDSYR